MGISLSLFKQEKTLEKISLCNGQFAVLWLTDQPLPLTLTFSHIEIHHCGWQRVVQVSLERQHFPQV